MLFSSAYVAMVGTLFSLISQDTIVISDELNHNCIINAIRMARPKDKKIYSHNNMAELESALKENGVLATGLNYPVVPRGDDEIRFQVCADQSFADLDSVLEILGNFRISRD
jgi:7-keto-8-aminopelargonate synthetase-like enzyme